MSVPGFNISNRTSLFTGVDSKLDYAFTEPEVEKKRSFGSRLGGFFKKRFGN